jgi:hypothetical protein
MGAHLMGRVSQRSSGLTCNRVLAFRTPGEEKLLWFCYIVEFIEMRSYNLSGRQQQVVWSGIREQYYKYINYVKLNACP